MCKRVLASIILLLAVLILPGCNREGDIADYGGYLVVKGAVYDKETGEPVKGIRIVMASYNRADLEKRNPQLTDTTFTAADGSYSATVNHIEHSDFYDIRAVDVDGDAEGGQYRDAQLKYISWNGLENPLYGQDIYMEKEK